MSDAKEKAQQAKARGNAAFSKADYDTAIKEFTTAIENDPTDQVFFSNRSASYANKQMYKEALADAEKCLQLKPDWPKGYSRKGVALFHLRKYEEAKVVYEKGLQLEPNNEQMKQALDEVKKALQPREDMNPFGKLFGESMWAKLATNSTTRPFLDDPAFVNKLKLLQKNPNLFSSFANDPKMSQALGVLLGIGADFGAAGSADEPFEPDEGGKKAGENAKPEKEEKETEKEKPKDEKKKKEDEMEVEKELSPEEKKQQDDKKHAEEEKNKGNDLYKQKKFDQALVHYNKAKELDPSNATFLANIAAVEFEQKEYEKCVTTCTDAIKVGRDNRTDYSTMAKLYFRMGNAYMQLKKYDDAINAYEKSLIEQHTDQAKQALKKAKETKKKMEEEAYFDKGKSLEHKEKGNEHFKNGKLVEALNEYTEAVRRDPSNPSLYSNRAACYTKLMDWQRGLEDCEKALQLDPKFVKVYIRKGKIQHFLKQYHKALETYNKAIELDPNATEAIDGKRLTLDAIRQQNMKGEADPQRVQEAMKDPEIRSILHDPTINKVLQDLKEDPRSAQAALQDKDIRGKIEKLIAAGILAVQ